MKLVRNKWNCCMYTVLEQKDGKVTLQRADGSQLTIDEKEFQFNYKEQKLKGVDKVN